MIYTFSQLICFLLIYSFMGWLMEVLLLVASGNPISNRGFFNLPICLEYGVMADLLLIILSPSGESLSLANVVLQTFLTVAVVAMVDFFSNHITGRIWRRRIRPYQQYNILGGRFRGAMITLLQALLVLLTIKLLHPFVYLAILLLPGMVLRMTNVVIVLALALDFLVTCISARKCQSEEELEVIHSQKQTKKSHTQKGIIHRLSQFVRKRMKHAYPQMESLSDIQPGGDTVFARGLCLDKLIWIFVLTALLGDLIETLYCRFTAGYWMSRSSVIYGTFSIVWGFGGVLITVIMSHLRHKEDRYVFFTGAVLGGAYEYSCSVLSEYVFGTTFWDYSHMMFNIGGRTNLLFCLFWGIIAVFWVKICYPRLSGWIEKLHPIYGKILTWGVVLVMVADMILSGAVLIRYVRRTADLPAANQLEEFIDHSYPDLFVETTWPNMQIQNNG